MADVIQKAVTAESIKNGTAVVYTGNPITVFQPSSGRDQAPTTGNLNFLDIRFDDPQYYSA